MDGVNWQVWARQEVPERMRRHSGPCSLCCAHGTVGEKCVAFKSLRLQVTAVSRLWLHRAFLAFLGIDGVLMVEAVVGIRQRIAELSP